MTPQKLFVPLIICIIFAGFWSRFYNLSNIPPGVHGDEGEFGIRQQKVMVGRNYNFFSLHDPYSLFNYSVLNYWTQGIFQKIFGENVFGIRASSAFAGGITLIAFYFMIRQFFSSKLTSALLILALTSSHWHIAYSRLAMNNSWTPLFTILTLGFLYKGFRSEKIRYYIISGIAAGLSLYFAQANRVIVIISFLWILNHALFITPKKRIGELTMKALIYAVSGAMIFFPLALYYWQNPGTFNFRVEAVSVFNHLPQYFIRYHTESVIMVLIWQFLHTLKIFAIGGDIGYYIYAYPGGMLAPIVSAFTIGGIVLSFVYIKQEKSLLFLSWFFSVVILGGVFTVDAPSSQRLLAVIPVLFLFSGLGIEYMIRNKSNFVKAVVLSLFVLNSFWDFKIYFIDYINSRWGWAQREPATQIAYYLRALGPDWKVYMLREHVWFLFEHGTIQFINPELEGVDVYEPENEIPIRDKIGKNIVYIMHPGSSSLENIKQAYPFGKIKFFVNQIDSQPSFTSVEVRKEDLFQ
jgi:4-amino-4-deoxy-L-arabinose transferase-like glycosyltransferase